MKNIRNFLLSVGACALCLNAYPWGQKGHDVVAYIAECHLTPAAKTAVDSIFDGKSLVYWANWLDNASHTPAYEYTLTWHYKNVDADKTIDNMPEVKSGDILTALESQELVLADTALSKADRALALKIVTHLYGDLHQPLHLGRLTDRGGNRHYVKFFRQGTNLHKIWDSNLPEAVHKWSYTEWQREIDRATPQEVTEILAPGSPVGYGRETSLLCKRIYDATPADTTVEYSYIADWTPTVEQQLLKGGLRLADTLNRIFDHDYKSPQVEKPAE